jgi:glycyl-tRNA synthetase beta chain
MSDFLLELLSEEIPARMQAKAQLDLARLFAEQLAAAGLTAAAIETFSTPRRLALIARGLPAQTEAVREELKGPRVGAPPQALEGFLRKTGLAQDQLVERDGVLFAAIERPGRATCALLAEAIPAIVRAFPWPKSMRWGAASVSTESPRWVRPIHGIVALLGEEIVEFEIAGIRSGAATMGHRFHHPGIITIGSAGDYAEKLRACHVIVDPAERRRIIAEGARAAAEAAGLTLVEDEGLVAENAGLTEWPVPLLGAFDPAFLDVPREVIQLTMRTNQKYFACLDASGALAPNFVCTANIEASDGGAAIVDGNRKVLAARLSDAKFFWEQDLEVPLEDQAAKLSQIVFHEKLGTVADKVERVAKLARWLVEEGIVGVPPPARHPREMMGLPSRRPGDGAAPSWDPASSSTAQKEKRDSRFRGNDGDGLNGDLADLAERAAWLAKADLVTSMVGEFPELQGVIGGYLARAQGEPDEVADAIRDHYKPVGQGDEVPTAPVTVAVSLADKLDTLIGFFAEGEKPTGSKDPFALRRAALAILSTLIAGDIRLPLYRAILRSRWWLGSAYTAYWQDCAARGEPPRKHVGKNPFTKADRDFLVDPSGENPDTRDGKIRDRIGNLPLTQAIILAVGSEVVDFLADRLKVQQREAGIRHDLIDAVFALGGEDDLVRLLARVRALQAFVETGEGADLLAGYKRGANILKKENWTEGGSTTSGHAAVPEEAALVAALDAAEPKARAAIEAEDFEGAMAALAGLRGPVDAFFDKVIVNDPDPAKRAARLDLLARMRDLFHQVADFSRIEG